MSFYSVWVVVYYACRFGTLLASITVLRSVNMPKWGPGQALCRYWCGLVCLGVGPAGPMGTTRYDWAMDCAGLGSHGPLIFPFFFLKFMPPWVRRWQKKRKSRKITTIPKIKNIVHYNLQVHQQIEVHHKKIQHPIPQSDLVEDEG